MKAGGLFFNNAGSQQSWLLPASLKKSLDICYSNNKYFVTYFA